MARFYGSIWGSHGKATRLGGAGSGLRTVAASYSGCVKVYLFDHDGEDWCEVRLDSWQGSGTDKMLYRGPVNYGSMDKSTQWRVDHPIAMNPKVKRT